MANCICRMVNGYHLTDDNVYVPGIISIAINPSSGKGYNTGTITITAHGFDESTGPYLLRGGGEYCDFVRIQGSINWNLKIKCGTDSPLSDMEIPGDEPDSGRTILIPQIQAPISIETGDGELPNLPSPYSLETDEEDLLNATDTNLSPSYTLDGSGGPGRKFSKGYRREYKWLKFVGIHPLFTFNTKDDATHNIDEPSTIEVQATGSSDSDEFTVYPQSFALSVEPPRPAVLTFTFIYVDNNKKILEIDNCLE